VGATRVNFKDALKDGSGTEFIVKSDGITPAIPEHLFTKGHSDRDLSSSRTHGCHPPAAAPGAADGSGSPWVAVLTAVLYALIIAAGLPW